MARSTRADSSTVPPASGDPQRLLCAGQPGRVQAGHRRTGRRPVVRPRRGARSRSGPGSRSIHADQGAAGGRPPTRRPAHRPWAPRSSRRSPAAGRGHRPWRRRPWPWSVAARRTRQRSGGPHRPTPGSRLVLGHHQGRPRRVARARRLDRQVRAQATPRLSTSSASPLLEDEPKACRRARGRPGAGAGRCSGAVRADASPDRGRQSWSRHRWADRSAGLTPIRWGSVPPVGARLSPGTGRRRPSPGSAPVEPYPDPGTAITKSLGSTARSTDVTSMGSVAEGCHRPGRERWRPVAFATMMPDACDHRLRRRLRPVHRGHRGPVGAGHPVHPPAGGGRRGRRWLAERKRTTTTGSPDS